MATLAAIGRDIAITLLPAPLSARPVLRALLHEYLTELAAGADVSARAAVAGPYAWFDAYWIERSRHPFLIRRGDQVLGFALVRDQESTGTDACQVAEFYVAPPYRRRGVGREAARVLFCLFPGPWTLRVQHGDARAEHFWLAAIQSVSSESMVSTVLSDAMQLRFVVRDEGCRPVDTLSQNETA